MCYEKLFFILIQKSRPHLQPAPRAKLLSLCTVTLESFRVSLSMALRRPGYSDWSIGYMPEGQKTRDRVHIISKKDSFHLLWKVLSALTVRRDTTCTEGVLCLTTCPMIQGYLKTASCTDQLCQYICFFQWCPKFQLLLQIFRDIYLTARSSCRGENLLPAKTMALAGLKPGRASTGCSWR